MSLINIKELHVHVTMDNNSVLEQLSLITKKIENLMSKSDDIKALVSGINDTTNNIAADLERLAGVIAGGITAEEADGIIVELQAAADKLKAVADVNPEPPVEPV